MTDQNEKSFQKQDAHVAKRSLTGKAKKSGSKGRWYKDVGLGFKTPKAAIEGTYVDKKCPFTGNVSIRGRIVKGVVIRCVWTAAWSWAVVVARWWWWLRGGGVRGKEREEPWPTRSVSYPRRMQGSWKHVALVVSCFCFALRCDAW